MTEQHLYNNEILFVENGWRVQNTFSIIALKPVFLDLLLRDPQMVHGFACSQLLSGGPQNPAVK